MEVIIQKTPAKASVLAAKIIAKQIQEKPHSVLGLATGRSPLKTYTELIRMHREAGLSFAEVTTFNLDEYVGLSPDHPQSYHYFMREKFFRHIDINPAATFIPAGDVDDLREECNRYEGKIHAAGGIDLQVLGLGSNGHIGFNEPTGSLRSRTWVRILSKNTLQDNRAAYGPEHETPHHCITMGIQTIMEAERILVLAFGAKKAKAVAQMIEGPVTSICPASALQFHKRVIVLLDEEAASELRYADHYRWVDQNKLAWQRYD